MSETTRKKLQAHCAKIEGQIKGISNMIAEDRSCVDLIIQISAASSSLTSLAKKIMAHHVEHCVVEGIKRGEDTETVNQLKLAFDQFSKLK